MASSNPGREGGVTFRIVLVLYCATLLLLPWGWFPPFPFIPKPAQWSDAVFAATVVAWVVERWQTGKQPRWDWAHAAVACYFAAATLSFLVATPDRADGAWKLLGIAELCMLAVVTSDLARRPGVLPLIGRVVAVTSILSAVAALIGVGLFYAGTWTRLVGTYGDLTPSAWYARAEAGTFHPNLLASFCIFAITVVARNESSLPVWLRRAAQVAIWLAVVLTFSRCILAVGLAVLIQNARTQMRRLVAASYAAACVIVIAVLTVWNLSLDPTRPAAAHVSPEPSARWQSITASLQTLKSRPLFGSGLRVPPGRKNGMPFDAHLTPLNIAATMGLPALAAFVSLPIILWRGRSRPTDLALWGGLAGMALDGLAQDVEDFRHLWVLFGLAGANTTDGGRSYAFSLAQRLIAGLEASAVLSPVYWASRKNLGRAVNRPPDISITAHPTVNGWAREKPISTNASGLCSCRWVSPTVKVGSRYAAKKWPSSYHRKLNANWLSARFSFLSSPVVKELAAVRITQHRRTI